MTEQDKERIEKEAINPNLVHEDLKTWTEGYIDGATAEHKLLKPQLEYADNYIQMVTESRDKLAQQLKQRDETIKQLNSDFGKVRYDFQQINSRLMNDIITYKTEIQQLKEEYNELAEMFALALEAGRDAQLAYNILVSAGCKLPSSKAIELHRLNAVAQEKAKRTNQYTDKIKIARKLL